MDHKWGISRITIGTIFGIAVAIVIMVLFVRYLRQVCMLKTSHTAMRSCSLPIRTDGADLSICSPEAKPHHQFLQLNLHLLDSFKFWGQQCPRSPQEKIVRFMYKELQEATNNFTTIIGKGGFGFVYKALLSTSAIVAVKVLRSDSQQGEKEFLNEVMLLGRLHHKNLVNLVGYCSEGGHRLLAYDYMSNGSLAARLHDERFDPLRWDQRVTIAQDVARGLEYLHDGAVPPVIHRDIKSSNVLLDTFMVARVADFGLSKEVNPDITISGIRGTYGYIDPEYVYTNTLTYKSDVYSFGVLLFELIAGRSPKDGLMELVELLLIAIKGSEAWLQILDPRLKGDCNIKELADMAMIAAKCVEKEARQRPRMQEVFQALMRLGPRNSRKLDFLNLTSFKKLENTGGVSKGHNH